MHVRFVLVPHASDRHSLTKLLGPFELTKNAMVISKQLANSTATSLNDPIRNSYQGKGTLRTARQIVRNCGLGGLYSGFRLQFSKGTICPPSQFFVLTWAFRPVRETFGTGMYFMAYESGKQLLVSYQGVNSPTSPGAVVVAGACCGIIALATVSEFVPCIDRCSRSLDVSSRSRQDCLSACVSRTRKIRENESASHRVFQESQLPRHDRSGLPIGPYQRLALFDVRICQETYQQPGQSDRGQTLEYQVKRRRAVVFFSSLLARSH